MPLSSCVHVQVMFIIPFSVLITVNVRISSSIEKSQVRKEADNCKFSRRARRFSVCLKKYDNIIASH